MAEVAVIGSGIAGMGAAWWLTACGHSVTMYAGEARVGGHSHTLLAHTVQGRQVPVDTGFMAFNAQTSPNLAALFALLEVPTQRCDLSFGVSLEGGKVEFATDRLSGLFAQPALALSLRHWQMLRDRMRFCRQAPKLLEDTQADPTLLEYLQAGGYSDAFVSRYLIPLAMSFWSLPAAHMMAFPAREFIRFFINHGLLHLSGRPNWQTVRGGSIEYVRRLTASYSLGIVPHAASRIKRTAAGPMVEAAGTVKAYDAVVLACHADQALALVDEPTPAELQTLGAFTYCENTAVLHQDDSLMPVRGSAWASCTYMSHPTGKAALTYWMNNLQDIDDETPLFVTLNPPVAPRADLTLATIPYRQPVLDHAALAAQEYLGSLQGLGGLWYCGAWSGLGMHEDGLTSGLTVAEYLTGQARPWQVSEMSPAALNARPAQQQLMAA